MFMVACCTGCACVYFNTSGVDDQEIVGSFILHKTSNMCITGAYTTPAAMTLLLFFIALLFELIYIWLFALTIRKPGFRFWPPPAARSWQFFAAWLLAGTVAVIFLALGAVDFDSGCLPGLKVRLPISLIFFVPGVLIGTWTSVVFEQRAMIGLGNKLVTRGPYRFTRNPQYIGDSLNILGFIIFTNSWMAGVLGILGVLLNIMAPLAEEPWLAERFGDSYREYMRRVPRWLGKPEI